MTTGANQDRRPFPPAGTGTGRVDAPGTYALMLRCRQSGTVSVGSLGKLSIEPGTYLYVGSAFGPGGLRARLSRHAARNKLKRWHIDYLRPRTSLVCAWFSTSPERLEHEWAASVRAVSSARIPQPGFGASDCTCSSHLFRFPDSASDSESGFDSSRRSAAEALAASGGDSFGWLEAGRLRGLTRRRR